MIFKPTRWRSPAHRRNVAGLACVACGLEGYTQAAHRNETKGIGIKACDSQMMALCIDCHRAIDQGGKLNRESRREVEKAYVKVTRSRLIAADKWPAAAEMAYAEWMK